VTLYFCKRIYSTTVGPCSSEDHQGHYKPTLHKYTQNTGQTDKDMRQTTRSGVFRWKDHRLLLNCEFVYA